MKQHELMHAIGDAMERDPEGWWKEFEYFNYRDDKWEALKSKHDLAYPMLYGVVRPKPKTYTLHIEGMPEGECGHSDVYRNASDGYTLALTVEYPDEQTAREALEKMTSAMGGGE